MTLYIDVHTYIVTHGTKRFEKKINDIMLLAKSADDLVFTNKFWAIL